MSRWLAGCLSLWLSRTIYPRLHPASHTGPPGHCLSQLWQSVHFLQAPRSSYEFSHTVVLHQDGVKAAMRTVVVKRGVFRATGQQKVNTALVRWNLKCLKVQHIHVFLHRFIFLSHFRERKQMTCELWNLTFSFAPQKWFRLELQIMKNLAIILSMNHFVHGLIIYLAQI